MNRDEPDVGSGLPGLSDDAPRTPQTLVIESFVLHWRHPSGHGPDQPTVLVITPIAYDQGEAVAIGGKQYQLVLMPDTFAGFQKDVERGGYSSPVEIARTLRSLDNGS